MRAALPLFICVLSALLGAALPASAQTASDRVSRIEIYNGATRTVSYVAPTLSPGEAQSLRELERLENEVSYLRELSALKREYVVSERTLEPYRRQVQQMLYSYDITGSSTSFVSYPYAGWGRGGWGWGGLGGGYGYPGFASTSTTINRSLANGMGDEGVVKGALAAALAQQSSVEYATAVDRALARVSTSPGVQAAFRKGGKPDGGVRPAVDDDSPIVLTLKNGEKMRGTRLEEKGAWFVMTLPGNRQVRVRESEVVRIEANRADAIVPAAGKP